MKTCLQAFLQPTWAAEHESYAFIVTRKKYVDWHFQIFVTKTSGAFLQPGWRKATNYSVFGDGTDILYVPNFATNCQAFKNEKIHREVRYHEGDEATGAILEQLRQSWLTSTPSRLSQMHKNRNLRRLYFFFFWFFSSMFPFTSQVSREHNFVFG